MAAPWPSDELRDILLSIGTHKKSRRKKPGEIAEAISRRLKVTSADAVARELHLADASLVHRFNSLMTLPSEIIPLVQWGSDRGHLSFSVAAEIARIPDRNLVAPFAKDALELNLTKTEAQAVVQGIKRSGKSYQLCLQDVLNLRRSVERQFLYVGSFKAPDLSRTENAGSTLRTALGDLFGSERVLSAAVKNGRFSFLLREDAATDPRFRSDLQPGNLEKFVLRLVKEDLHD